MRGTQQDAALGLRWRRAEGMDGRESDSYEWRSENAFISKNLDGSLFLEIIDGGLFLKEIKR